MLPWIVDLSIPLWLLGIVSALLLVTIGHELGHYLAARLVHIPVKQIALGMGPEVWRVRLGNGMRFVVRLLPLSAAVGVLGRWTRRGSLRRPVNHDLLVAAAGPLASFILTLGLLLLAFVLQGATVFRIWLVTTALLSTLVALLNLLPIPGLDGGHLLLLGLQKLGVRLGPYREQQLHRNGARLVALAAMLILLIQIIIRWEG